MFDSSRVTGSKFIEFIKKQIDMKEFSALSREAGFADPNTFTVEQVVQPLIDEEFPQYDHYEYLWAIFESDLERLRRYSRWMKIYLSSLYIYCNKVKQWGMVVESDYFYLVVETELDDPDLDSARQFLTFLEWLYEYVEGDDGYDDFYCLLTWTLLRRLIGATDDELFLRVRKTLSDRIPLERHLSELTVSKRDVSSWFDLHQRIPLSEEYPIK